MTIPTASRLDSLRYVVGHLLAQYFQGLFVRRPFHVRVWARVCRGPLSPGIGQRLQRRHQSRGVYLRVLRGRQLLVFADRDVQRVLDRSPDLYAEGSAKRRGMEAFQPGALTISREADWRQRRALTEAVLPDRGDADESVFAAALRSVDELVRERLPAKGRVLRWEWVDELHEAIALRLLFGVVDPEGRALARDLRRSMLRANRLLFLRDDGRHARWMERLTDYAERATPDSLVGRLAKAPQAARTQAFAQVPHWMFALRDTLAENVGRSLAMVFADPDREHQVRAEVKAGKRKVGGIHALTFVEGCIRETMRLWPTTPTLVRELTSSDVLCGGVVPRGMSVVVPVDLLHLDTIRCRDALAFRPERWAEPGASERFLALGGGGQVCPGADLALYLAKATVSAVVRGGTFELRAPDLQGELPAVHDYTALALVRS